MTVLRAVAGGPTQPVVRLPRETRGFGLGDLNPLKWLGDKASEVAGDAWLSAMSGLWSAALWLLKLAFRIVDAFTTPDLSGDGPMGSVLPTTLWAGGALAVLMMFIQLTVALVRRDGASMARPLIGTAQFALVWAGFLGVGAGLVAAAAGLTRGILDAMLDVGSLSEVDLSGNFPNHVTDITLATVLGVLGLLIVVPAAFFYTVIMFVREAALIILVATAPISAGGLVSDVGRVWFWKTLRWFFSCLLIAPLAALVLGIGVQLSNGVIEPPTKPGADADIVETIDYTSHANAAHAGMAVVGCMVIAIGAVCPLILFRLLAFVDPGTASGAALRQSWSDAGGMPGLLSRHSESGGSSAATQTSAEGRAGGETTAESQTQSRLTGAMGAAGAGLQLATSMAHRAADLGSDVLGQSGVGTGGYSLTPTDHRATRAAHTGSGSGDRPEVDTGPDQPHTGTDGTKDGSPPPTPSPDPAPPSAEPPTATPRLPQAPAAGTSGAPSEPSGGNESPVPGGKKGAEGAAGAGGAAP